VLPAKGGDDLRPGGTDHHVQESARADEGQREEEGGESVTHIQSPYLSTA
jgi:hypothetical protein